jgi:hypothetical protein
MLGSILGQYTGYPARGSSRRFLKYLQINAGIAPTLSPLPSKSLPIYHSWNIVLFDTVHPRCWRRRATAHIENIREDGSLVLSRTCCYRNKSLWMLRKEAGLTIDGPYISIGHGSSFIHPVQVQLFLHLFGRLAGAHSRARSERRP